MACATLRTFSYVKSSAITPRQPSVPNLISAAAFSDLSRFDNPAPVSALQQLLRLLFLEPFHDFADVLRALARRRPAARRPSRPPPDRARRSRRRICAGSRSSFPPRPVRKTARPRHSLRASPRAARRRPPRNRCRSSRPSPESRRRASCRARVAGSMMA